MASIDELKRHIDLHDLAGRLGLKRGRGGDRALYHSPQHADRLVAVDLCESPEVRHRLARSQRRRRRLVHRPRDPRARRHGGRRRPLSPRRVWPPDRATGARRAPREIYRRIHRRSLHGRARSRARLPRRPRHLRRGARRGVRGAHARLQFVDGPKIAAGDVGHGGPAAAFVVRAPGDARVVAVDMRYVDPRSTAASRRRPRATRPATDGPPMHAGSSARNA